MSAPPRIAASWPYAALLACAVACGPAPATPDETAGALTTASASGDEPTVTTEPAPPTTSTTATTSTGTTTDPADTGATTEPTPICETCSDDEICVQTLDEHTCGFPGEGGERCVQNPHGCVPSDPCSVACHDLCGTDFCEGNPMCATTPGALQCWSYQGQPGWNCDALAQDDCIAGKKCVPYNGDRTKCVPIVEPTKAPGEACEGPDFDGVDDCAAGAACVAGTCVALCSPDDLACADPATGCAVDNPQVGLCLPTCEPLAPTCAADEVCVAQSTQAGLFVCVPDASGAGGQALTPCEFPGGCDPGLVCSPSVTVSAACRSRACCTPFCDLQGDAPCPAPDQTCVPFFDPQDPPPGHESLGACGLAE